MFDVLLHTGLEHPSLAWIVIPTILAFLGGLLLGRYKQRIEAGRDSPASE